MYAKIILLVVSLSLLLTACSKPIVSGTLPHNNCAVAACDTTSKGHLYIFGYEVTK